MDATHKRFMEKYLKYFVLMLATVLSLSLASCGGGDDDEPDQPGKPSGKYEVVSRTINANAEFLIYFIPYGSDSNSSFSRVNTNKNDDGGIYLTCSGFIAGARSLRYAACGEVKSLESIKSVDGLNWVQEGNAYKPGLTVDIKCGFVIEKTYNGQAYYVRLFVDSFNRNASGDIIGINLKWQQFTPAQ